MYTIPDSDHMSDMPNQQIIKHLDRAFTVFEAAESSFAVAPCNTTHQFLPLRHRDSTVQMLSIVNAVMKIEADRLRGKRVLFLSTRQTQIARLYDQMFSLTRAQQVLLTQPDQAKLDDLIEKANAGGTLDDLKPSLSDIVTKYNSDVVLLACTELSLFLPITTSKPIIDSLGALAEATYSVSSRETDISFYTAA
jgi:aspartate/glutamate racemase